jgi:hypothetical protein
MGGRKDRSRDDRNRGSNATVTNRQCDSRGGEGIDGSVARRKDTRGTKQDIDGHKTQGSPFPLSVRSGKWLNAIGQLEI